MSMDACPFDHLACSGGRGDDNGNDSSSSRDSGSSSDDDGEICPAELAECLVSV